MVTHIYLEDFELDMHHSVIEDDAGSYCALTFEPAMLTLYLNGEQLVQLQKMIEFAIRDTPQDRYGKVPA